MVMKLTLSAGLSAGLAIACQPTTLSDVAAADESAPPWAFCPQAPTAPEAIDPTRLWLQFGPDALYCSLEQNRYVDDRSAYGQLDDKRQLRLVASDNFLPIDDGSHARELSLCVLGANDTRVLGQDYKGEWRVERSEQVNGERVRYEYEHRGLTEQGEEASVTVELGGYTSALDDGVRLNGETWPAEDPSLTLSLEERARSTTFDACRLDVAVTNHVLTFAGGELELSLHIDDRWPGFAAPKRARLLAAAGFFDGVAVSQSSFWHLGVREVWPGSDVLELAVRFSAPIGEICGVSVAIPKVPGTSPSGKVTSEGCDGSRQERRLSSHAITGSEAP